MTVSTVNQPDPMPSRRQGLKVLRTRSFQGSSDGIQMHKKEDLESTSCPDCDQRFMVPWARKYFNRLEKKKVDEVYKCPKRKMDLTSQIDKLKQLNPKGSEAHDWPVVDNVMFCKKCLILFCSFGLLRTPGVASRKSSPTEDIAKSPCRLPWVDDAFVFIKPVYLTLLTMNCFLASYDA